MKSKAMLVLLSLTAISFFPGCEKRGPVEKAGRQSDEAVDEIQQKAEDAGKDIKESINE